MSEITPTLFIGFGGTGYSVLSNIKTSLANTFSKDGEVPGIFQFVVIDIDEASIGSAELPESNYTFEPKTNEFLAAKLPPPSQLADRINRKTKKYKYVQPWWPKKLSSQAAEIHKERNIDQAYQVRKFGRVAFFAYFEDYKKRIEAAIKHITDADRLRELGDYHDIESSGMRLNVHVVCSLAGGTGCGMFLDGLAVLHDILEQGNNNYTVSSYFVLPDVFKDVEEDLKTPRVNAYGALKELDSLLSGKESLTQRYTDSYEIKDVNELTDYAYLLDVQNEGGIGFGGRQTIGRMISEYIFHLSTSLGRNIDQGQGRKSLFAGYHSLEEGGTQVSHAYSSFGYQEVAFLFEDIVHYVKQYNKQCILAFLKKGYEHLEEEKMLHTIKEILEGDLGSDYDYEMHKWFDSLMPKIGRWEVPFLHRDSFHYRETERKRLKRTIKQSYLQAKKTIDAQEARCESISSFNDEDQLDQASQWIHINISRFLQDPHKGIKGAEQFLNELEERISSAKNMFVSEFKEADDNILQAKEVRAIEKKLETAQKKLFWKSRNNLIRYSLKTLQDDVKQYRKAKRNRLFQKSLEYLLENSIQVERETLRRLESELGEGLQTQRSNLKKLLKKMAYRKDNQRFCVYVGCEEKDIEDIEGKIKGISLSQDSQARQVMANKFSIDSVNWDELARVAVDRLGVENETVLDHMGDGEEMVEFLNETAKKATPLWSYSEEGSPAFYLLSSLPEKVWNARLKGSGGNLTSQRMPTNALDKGKICIIGLRDAVPAEYIKSVRQYYNVYKDRKGRATKLDVPVNVLPNSNRWDELIPISFSTKPHIEAAEVIGVLKRKGGGYCDVELETTQTYRHKHLPTILSEDASLRQQLEDAIRRELLEMGPTACKKWFFEHSDVVPEKIEIDVRGKLGI